jgi:hypothetical protein
LFSIACVPVQGFVNSRMTPEENESLNGNGLAGNGNISYWKIHF